jgi:hypothetical protein
MDVLNQDLTGLIVQSRGTSLCEIFILLLFSLFFLQDFCKDIPTYITYSPFSFSFPEESSHFL